MRHRGSRFELRTVRCCRSPPSGEFRLRTLRALRTGVGLSNTRARLDCLYGRLYRLEFSDKDGGLTVLIEIPFQRVAASSAAAAAFRVA